ncbi:O-antigen polysaccharide polymerase Wzy [Shewanella sp. ECSMB14102]|uniref:O-antigen polysaccharide polymerase Wzy n=1 Tax=Shewanella sp. ECSMB14102 TaxID=1579504 RepID=UPI00057A6D5E|nr:O-antigen polysaccharide polymerase Wzy [Shewanella sp. ECSMB14102]
MIIKLEIRGFAFIVTTILLLILLNVFYFNSEIKSKAFIAVSITGCILWMLAFTMVKSRFINTASIITPVNLFFLAYVILYFQVPLLELLDLKVADRFIYFIWNNEDVINKSVFYSVSGVFFFVLGSSFILSSRFLSRKSKRFNAAFLTIIAYVFYIAFFLTSGSYKVGAYNPDDALSVNPYFFKLFNVFFSASIILNLCNISQKSKGRESVLRYIFYFDKSILLLFIWHVLFSLFVGDRGPVISYTLLVFSLYFIKHSKMKIYQILLLIVMASIVLSVIGSVRQARFDGGSLTERLSQQAQSNGNENKYFGSAVVGEGTIELALSIRSLNHAIANVPENYDYKYGFFLTQGIAASIPGVGTIFNYLFTNGESYLNGSANFVSYMIQNGNVKYGDGTSILVDFYLDFGFIGICIAMFLLGGTFVFFEKKLVEPFYYPSLGIVSALVIFSKSIYLVRSSIYLELGNLLLIYFVILINNFFMKKSI